jgi:prevent-host-death family protein
VWLDDHRTALYRLYDEADALLYIGISHQPEVRFDQHAMAKEWWPQVARREVQWFDDRPSAAAAEAAAIRAEDPEHNRTYSPRRDCRIVRDAVAADGLREVSLSLARPRIAGLIRSVEEDGVPVVLMNRQRREAVIVPIDFYDRALEYAAKRRELEALTALGEQRVLVKPTDARDVQAARNVAES